MLQHKLLNIAGRAVKNSIKPQPNNRDVI